MDIVITLAIGLIAGWAASFLMDRRGFGVAGDIVVGLLGAVLGSYMFDWLGLGTQGIFERIISATVGSAILLFIVGLLIEKPLKT